MTGSSSLGFHYKDNWYFQRLQDGTVEIVHRDPTAYFKLTVDKDSWASIVASVSQRGEEDGRYLKALDFHMK